MRRLLATTFVLTGLFMAMAAPAFGASQRDHADCNALDPDRNIVGCTRIIEDSSERDRIRAIAYVGRGLAWSAKGEGDHPSYYNNRGNAWHARGDDDRALADYDKAIRLNPKNAAYYNNRRDAWLAKGDLARAIADANEARRLGSDNPN